MDGAAENLQVLGVLAEPQRARIYQLVARHGTRTRQEICDALGLGRTLVTFHLEKLRQAGLVEPVPETTPTGRPGRPAQRYRISGRELNATVPPRRYDLIAEILLRAVGSQHPDESLRQAAIRVATAQGRRLAREEHLATGAGYAPGAADASPAPDVGDARTGLEGSITASSDPWTALHRLLTRLGYAPIHDGTTLILMNCPFQRLRAIDAGLVCAINLALHHGYLEVLDTAGSLTARLRPRPDTCCVVLEPSPARTEG